MYKQPNKCVGVFVTMIKKIVPLDRMKMLKILSTNKDNIKIMERIFNGKKTIICFNCPEMKIFLPLEENINYH